ncbi:competence protein CoiA-like family protein [Cupriavidus basilensis OR16]|uniref:Competence protein CoiA-like family protein n=1 Tax=Cupriavidus basilensis OR16 TaxID=1127483 RepID=H1S002_9BURK|nr:competence protein CoiA family protein [Cupriavidus basilensis]EHP44218.1 competence protein CoiA-like family protein [Cupriavidus basilensis OR16]
MLVALLNGARTFAALAQKGPTYDCPGCGQVVTLKKGLKVIHHFAHKPPVTCTWAKGETAAHMAAKKLFLDHLRALPRVADVEFPIGTQRADVYALGKNGAPYVFEMQHQPITEQDIARRTQDYFKQGAAVTWLPLIDLSKLTTKKTATGHIIERYSPKPFEKWLQGFNFKELWYVEPSTGLLWQGKFDKAMLEVAYSEWHVSGGGTESAGGYSRPSKRWRKLTLTGPFTLAQLNITTTRRQSSSVGTHFYPQGNRIVFVPKSPVPSPPKE